MGEILTILAGLGTLAMPIIYFAFFLSAFKHVIKSVFTMLVYTFNVGNILGSLNSPDGLVQYIPFITGIRYLILVLAWVILTANIIMAAYDLVTGAVRGNRNANALNSVIRIVISVFLLFLQPQVMYVIQYAAGAVNSMSELIFGSLGLDSGTLNAVISHMDDVTDIIAGDAGETLMASIALTFIYITGITTAFTSAAFSYVERVLTFVFYIYLYPVAAAFYADRSSGQAWTQWLTGIFMQTLAVFLSMPFLRASIYAFAKMPWGTGIFIMNGSEDYAGTFLAFIVGITMANISKNMEKILGSFGFRTVPAGELAASFTGAMNSGIAATGIAANSLGNMVSRSAGSIAREYRSAAQPGRQLDRDLNPDPKIMPNGTGVAGSIRDPMKKSGLHAAEDALRNGQTEVDGGRVKTVMERDGIYMDRADTITGTAGEAYRNSMTAKEVARDANERLARRQASHPKMQELMKEHADIPADVFNDAMMLEGTSAKAETPLTWHEGSADPETGEVTGLSGYTYRMETGETAFYNGTDLKDTAGETARIGTGALSLQRNSDGTLRTNTMADGTAIGYTGSRGEFETLAGLQKSAAAAGVEAEQSVYRSGGYASGEAMMQEKARQYDSVHGGVQAAMAQAMSGYDSAQREIYSRQFESQNTERLESEFNAQKREYFSNEYDRSHADRNNLQGMSNAGRMSEADAERYEQAKRRYVSRHMKSPQVASERDAFVEGERQGFIERKMNSSEHAEGRKEAGEHAGREYLDRKSAALNGDAEAGALMQKAEAAREQASGEAFDRGYEKAVEQQKEHYEFMTGKKYPEDLIRDLPASSANPAVPDRRISDDRDFTGKQYDPKKVSEMLDRQAKENEKVFGSADTETGAEQTSETQDSELMKQLKNRRNSS